MRANRRRHHLSAPSKVSWTGHLRYRERLYDSFGTMVQTDRPRRLSEIRHHVRCWLALWGMPGFDENLTIEWSSRLRRSLGRAVPSRRLVRLSHLLLTARRKLVLETVCHEVAHVAVPVLHRNPCRPHGPEWAELVRTAGFAPRNRVNQSARGQAATVSVRRPSGAGVRLYVHTCPVCHARRLARRRISRWRCADCVTAGLDGRLTVEAIRARSS
jgi:predicted SprT family Zn-dependent metalloprotease